MFCKQALHTKRTSGFKNSLVCRSQAVADSSPIFSKVATRWARNRIIDISQNSADYTTIQVPANHPAAVRNPFQAERWSDKYTSHVPGNRSMAPDPGLMHR